VQAGVEHREASYMARAYRLLARIAMQEDDYASAAEHIARAVDVLGGCEAWTVEWKVQATAAQIYFHLNRLPESEAARAGSLRAAQRVAATLADEPSLRESLMQRVNRELAMLRSASA